MAIEHQNRLTCDELLDVKAAKSNLTILPIAVIFFAPHTIWYEHKISLIFFFGRFEFSIAPSSFYFDIFQFLGYLLFFFVPALAVSIVMSWALNRFSAKKTTDTRVLQIAIGATICWAIYLSMFFFVELSFGRLMVGPLPIAIGPLLAVLSRKSIMKMTNQIDAIDSSAL